MKKIIEKIITQKFLSFFLVTRLDFCYLRIRREGGTGGKGVREKMIKYIIYVLSLWEEVSTRSNSVHCLGIFPTLIKDVVDICYKDNILSIRAL